MQHNAADKTKAGTEVLECQAKREFESAVEATVGTTSPHAVKHASHDGQPDVAATSTALPQQVCPEECADAPASVAGDHQRASRSRVVDKLRNATRVAKNALFNAPTADGQPLGLLANTRRTGGLQQTEVERAVARERQRWEAKARRLAAKHEGDLRAAVKAARSELSLPRRLRVTSASGP